MSIKSEAEEITLYGGFIPKTVFIIALLCSLHFWDLKLFPPKYNVYNIIGWLICGFSFFMVIKNKNLHFKNAIIVFMVGVVANIFAAYNNLHQSFYESFFSNSFYYFILLYFLLHYLKLSRDYVENVIIFFAVIYSVIFTIQYKIYPNTIFNGNVQTAIGERQFEILGHGFLMLGYYLLLNRYLLNRRLINIILALFFFYVLSKCGFRTIIAGAFIITVMMVIRTLRFNPKDFLLMFFVGILFMGLLEYKGFSKIIDRMISKTETNLAEGDRYVRKVELEYYFKIYPRNLSYYVIGGGKPAGRNLYKYNYNIDDVRMNYNIVWVDIGLIGFYIVVGAIATLGMLLYTLKAIFLKLPRDSLYLNFYFLFLLIVSFTNEEIYRDGILSVQAIGLYLIDIAVNENHDQKSNLQTKELNIH